MTTKNHNKEHSNILKYRIVIIPENRKFLDQMIFKVHALRSVVTSLGIFCTPKSVHGEPMYKCSLETGYLQARFLIAIIDMC